MKKIYFSLIVVTFLIINTGCTKQIKDKKITDNNTVKESESNMEMITNINIVINNKSYNATLEESETAQTFVKLLPQEFYMKELNGNEKYYNMNQSFPTNASNPKHIEAGDIMLYGNNCIVIFYKSFTTTYSYTKIGHIDNLPDLGNDNITVKFVKE